jgi:UPF0271 protein
MRAIDLNCDMGEGCGNDDVLLEFVSSANIACGFHAGDADTMRRTAELALAKSVAIGAHPSFPDRENFGRTNMNLSPDEVTDIVSEQIAAMQNVCREIAATLHHVKPHGALYNMAAKEASLAEAIARAVQNVDADLIMYGLSGSFLITEAQRLGLKTASEVFADRTYTAEGTLTPRSQPNALIDSADESINQVLQMVEKGTVTATNGSEVPIEVETICIHGDGPHAVDFAKAIKTRLEQEGIKVCPTQR